MTADEIAKRLFRPQQWEGEEFTRWVGRFAAGDFDAVMRLERMKQRYRVFG